MMIQLAVWLVVLTGIFCSGQGKNCEDDKCCTHSDCPDSHLCVGAGWLFRCVCEEGFFSQAKDFGRCVANPEYESTGRDETINIWHDEKKRSAIVHLPPNGTGSGQSMPLVLNLHSMATTALFQQQLTGFDRLADKEGFVVVYPEGYSRPDIFDDPFGIPMVPFGATFNAGACCPAACRDKIDDVGFIHDLVKYISETWGPSQQEILIDSRRIYATGMSNGGFMSHRLGCELSDVIAAIAPVAGVMTATKDVALWKSDPYECNPDNAPLPVLHIHDVGDELVDFNGHGWPLDFPSVGESIDHWRRINDVLEESGLITYRSHDVLCTSYGSGRSNVTLCEVSNSGFGHSWPGSPGANGSLKATEQIWEFFKSNPKASNRH